MTREENVQEALIARARSMVAAVGLEEWQVGWPNMPFKPPAGGEIYVEVGFFPNRSDRYSHKGSDPESMMGFLQLLIKAPLNRGWRDASALAGKIGEHFPADLRLWSGGIRVTVSKKPDAMSALKTEATWNVPVTVYYEASG